MTKKNLKIFYIRSDSSRIRIWNIENRIRDPVQNYLDLQHRIILPQLNFRAFFMTHLVCMSEIQSFRQFIIPSFKKLITYLGGEEHLAGSDLGKIRVEISEDFNYSIHSVR